VICTEPNTVEQMILDAVTKLDSGPKSLLREDDQGWGESLGGELNPSFWNCMPAGQLPHQGRDVLVGSWIRKAHISLNPEIAALPDRIDTFGSETEGTKW